MEVADTLAYHNTSTFTAKITFYKAGILYLVKKGLRVIFKCCHRNLCSLIFMYFSLFNSTLGDWFLLFSSMSDG
jgi:hypothetical protein